MSGFRDMLVEQMIPRQKMIDIFLLPQFAGLKFDFQVKGNLSKD